MTHTHSPDFRFPKNHADLTLWENLPIHWVNNPTDLQRLIDEIQSVDTVALDTEFIKRTTYYPILALIQINTGKGIYLVDAPCLDLSELWQALSQVQTMVWYACGEDLGIFYLLADCPPLTNVFDVQIAVAYLTDQMQVGYSQAVNEILGIALDKGESKSDWLARPLSDDQWHYAINDVRYLLAVYDTVRHALNDKGLLDYVKEDCQRYAKEVHTAWHTPSHLLYLDYVASNYDARQLTLLRDLVAWRENIAKTKNQPKNFIIGKQPLREIVLDMPTNIPALAHTTLNRSALRRYGTQIIEMVRVAKTLPNDQLVAVIPTYISKHKPFKNPLEQAINAYSHQMQIPTSILMRGRWLNELLYMVYQDLDESHLPESLMGYRRAWIATTILPILHQYRTEIIAGFDV